MRSFFKIFFASFLSIIVFSLIVLFILIALVSRLTSKEEPLVAEKSVLVLNLGKHFNERKQANPLSNFSEEGDDPGLFDVIRLIMQKLIIIFQAFTLKQMAMEMDLPPVTS
jgi:protease-4